jgi:hypothetical protein
MAASRRAGSEIDNQIVPKIQLELIKENIYGLTIHLDLLAKMFILHVIARFLYHI